MSAAKQEPAQACFLQIIQETTLEFLDPKGGCKLTMYLGKTYFAIPK